MRIAILSDIHDNIWKLEEVLKAVNQAGAEVLLFCGDFCAPFTLAQIAEGFSRQIHCVFGNNDGDKFLLGQVAGKFSHVTLHGELARLELDGRRIAINHYPEIARELASGGHFDLVCHGHDHKAAITRQGSTLLVNPGEVMGRFGRSTFALYDTTTGEAAHHEV